MQHVNNKGNEEHDVSVISNVSASLKLFFEKFNYKLNFKKSVRK